MIDLFHRLGDVVEDGWRARRYDEEAFPSVAAAALRELRPHLHCTPSDLIDWALRGPLPPQFDLEARFGEPPLTLFRNQRFLIDANFWVDATPAIHDHRFAGAFQLLTGTAVHCRHRFAPSQEVGEHLMLGELAFQSAELLKPGEVREILPGGRFIHSNFQLERPSVTLVVRTPLSSTTRAQWGYHVPGVAVDRFARDEQSLRSRQLLHMLARCGDDGWIDRLGELVARTDLYSTFLLLESSCDRLEQIDRWEPMLERARAAHGPLIDLLAVALGDRKRERLINALRARCADPDHRFLLALALNVRSREQILALVKARVPERDPVELVLQWIGETAEAGLLGMPLDEVSRDLLDGLLRGKSQEQAIAQLVELYGESEVEEQAPALRELCRAFEGHVFFRALLG